MKHPPSPEPSPQPTPRADTQPGEAPAPTEPQTTPATEVDPTDPAAVWAALLSGVASQRSLAWMRYLKISKLEQDRVTLAAQPGHREVLAFCTDQRLAQIAEQLQPILGRRVRVSLERTAPQPDADTDATPSDAGPRTTDRRQAMGLPLVQRVLEVFPDATLVDARDEADIPPPPPEQNENQT